MFLEMCEVVENKRLSDIYYLMTIRCENISKEAKSGQFLMIKCPNGIRVLRRPISIHKIDREKNEIELYYEVLGEGTRELANLKVGEKVSIQGPLGHGFDTSIKGKKVLLIGGGMGNAPLKELGRELKKENKVTVIAGGRDSEAVAVTKGFEDEGLDLVITTDDGSVGSRGNVVEALKKELEEDIYDLIYTCGPHNMMLAVGDVAKKNNIRCQISLEERMACGVKACVGCSIKTHKGMKKVCSDGPVFEIESIVDFSPSGGESCSGK